MAVTWVTKVARPLGEGNTTGCANVGGTHLRPGVIAGKSPPYITLPLFLQYPHHGQPIRRS